MKPFADLYADRETKATLDSVPSSVPGVGPHISLTIHEGRPESYLRLARFDQYTPKFEGADPVWLTVVIGLGSLGYKFLSEVFSEIGKDLGRKIALVIEKWMDSPAKPVQRQALEFQCEGVSLSVQMDKKAQAAIVARPDGLVKEVFRVIEIDLSQANARIVETRIMFIDSESGEWKV